MSYLTAWELLYSKKRPNLKKTPNPKISGDKVIILTNDVITERKLEIKAKKGLFFVAP